MRAPIQQLSLTQIEELNWRELTQICEQNTDLRNIVFDFAFTKRRSLNISSTVVAGSAGKTTVKEMVGNLYQHWLNPTEVSVSAENQNTKIALASQIIKMPKSIKVGVFEVGARKVGDFKVPLKITDPDTVLLLNIGAAHLGEFGSLENLVKEKLSVLNSENIKNRIIFGDDERIRHYLHSLKAEYISFGYKKHNRVQIKSQNEDSIDFLIDDKLIHFGAKNLFPNVALNMAAVLALSIQLNIPIEDCAKSLKNFKGVKRRFELLKWDETQVVDDAFNASPESMRSGLEKFSEISKNKKIILVLGSMLELGNFSTEEHRKVGQHINTYFSKHIDHNLLRLVLVGEEAKEIATDVNLVKTQINWFADVDLAKTYLKEVKWNYDMLYLKASKSINLVKLLQFS